MIITIDGPAGAGKSSVARKLAARLDFDFLDTGAMYRAVTLAALQRSVDLENEGDVVAVAMSVKLSMAGDFVSVDGSDVSEQIRTPEVTRSIRYVADIPRVRERLNEIQQEIAATANIVTEGRDQGTDVFPDAKCKIFLTASSRERARRRQHQLLSKGVEMSVDQILEEQDRRDREDETRGMGALRKADDAVEVVTDGMQESDVVDRLEEIAKQAISDSA